MPFPRTAIVNRLNANVDDLVTKLGGGALARAEFLAEINSPGDSGDANPFLKVLFPSVTVAATIERSLSARLGRGWDHMVADVARSAHGNGETNHRVRGNIPVATATQINVIVEAYTRGVGHGVPNTRAELAAILPGVVLGGAKEPVDEVDDVYFLAAGGVENHVEIKTPKPNYDQARASKRRILRIHAVRAPIEVKAFVGMVYNPNGLYGDYTWPTTKYFLDLGTDLKVGREFWNYVGNSADTYDELLDCFLEVALARRADLGQLLAEV